MPVVQSKVVVWQNEAKFTGLFKGVDPRGQLAGSIEGVLRRRRLRRRRSIWFNETDGNVLVRGVSTAADDADGADANATPKGGRTHSVARRCHGT
jgi:hypothetical protein